MGIFDLFSSKLTQNKFAKIFAESARKQGFSTPMVYQEEEFQMVIGSDGKRVFNLVNAYRDYGNVPKAERHAVLKRYTASLDLPTIPLDFQIAKNNLMPSVKCRAQGEYVRRTSQLSNSNTQYTELSTPLGDDAVIMLAYDGEETLSVVVQSQLDDWGVTFEVAMETAIANLRDRTIDTFINLGDGVMLGQWNDAYDSSRILLQDVIYRAGGGDPVVMIPTRGRFLVGPSQSVAAQLKMIDFSLNSLQQDGRPVSAGMYKISDGLIVQYVPQHAEVVALLDQLKKMHLLDEYGSQKNMLEKIHENEEEEIFVATFNLYKNDATGRITSHATWSKDVKTLLPKTDLITLFQAGKTEADHKMFLVTWEDLWKVAGHSLEEVEGYPVRYLAADFPEDDVLASVPTAPSMAPQ
jgi:hypothetical protein